MQSVLADKCCGNIPLPRIVTYDEEYDSMSTNGFGLLVHQCSKFMIRNWQYGSCGHGNWKTLSSVETHQINQANTSMVAARPLCLEQGLIWMLNEQKMAMAGHSLIEGDLLPQVCFDETAIKVE